MKIQPSVKLSEYTTFQLGGSCLGLIDCQNPDELCEAIVQLTANQLPFILIGGGSNLLVSDENLDVYVIRYLSQNPIIEIQNNEMIVSGSTSLDDLVLFAIKESLSGINYASGIPGTVGGAIVGNAGAFGKQIGEVIKEVIVLTPSGHKKNILQKDLDFQYRHSILKESKDILLSATLLLIPSNQLQLQKEREEILVLRKEKHPDLKIHPCAGSFFRNIEPTSSAEKRQAVGWFLEESGVKNLKVGGAKVFDKHANIIVKDDNCSAKDVYQLSLQMAQTVKKKFDLDLVREVQLVGEFD